MVYCFSHITKMDDFGVPTLYETSKCTGAELHMSDMATSDMATSLCSQNRCRSQHKELIRALPGTFQI